MPTSVYRYMVWLSFAAFPMLQSCDPQRLKKCEWYLTPNPKGNKVMKVGWVSLCVTNFTLGRQRCFFTAKPDFVQSANGKAFRYSTMKYTETFPREIKSLTPCGK